MIRRRAIVTTLGTLALAAGGSLAWAAGPLAKVGRWQAGQHYNFVENPQPPSVAKGKVEVIEVFWYGCAHCYALDPVLEDWKRKKPKHVEFVRVPVIWGPVHRQHAKLYYTMLALGLGDLHPQVFDAIHKEGMPLSDRDEVRARSLHYGFLSTHGVSAEQFDAAYDSMTVATNMERARELTRNFNVGSVPLIFINGKYSTGVSEAGGPQPLVALINDLAASEKKR
jgi:thiol:disulfide interchange protein DsbA